MDVSYYAYANFDGGLFEALFAVKEKSRMDKYTDIITYPWSN